LKQRFRGLQRKENDKGAKNDPRKKEEKERKKVCTSRFSTSQVEEASGSVAIIITHRRVLCRIQQPRGLNAETVESDALEDGGVGVLDNQRAINVIDEGGLAGTCANEKTKRER
jgi:hypothetical protein